MGPAEAFKVGALFSLTGRASFLGDPEKKRVVIIADRINKAGGINGQKYSELLPAGIPEL